MPPKVCFNPEIIKKEDADEIDGAHRTAAQPCECAGDAGKKQGCFRSQTVRVHFLDKQVFMQDR